MSGMRNETRKTTETMRRGLEQVKRVKWQLEQRKPARHSVTPGSSPSCPYGPILPVSSVHPSPVGSLREVNGTRWEDGA